MQQNPQSPSPAAPGQRRIRARQVLAAMTGLFAVALLAAALWPAPSKSKPGATPPAPVPQAAATPAPTADPTPAPPVSTPAPSTAPLAPEPKPPDPLPPRPEGEPALLVVHGDRSCKQIAFTYDAGSGADGAAAILDTLKKQGVTATFFLTGKWVETYPELAKRIAAEGHEIANHTYSHPDLTKIPADEVLKQVKDGEAAIRRITGRETKPLFREPYGAFSDDERRLVRQAGFSYSIYWEVDTLDWQFPPIDTEVKRITERTTSGSIVLMHLNVPDTAIASDRAIPILREKGYRLVTVSQVLKCQ